MIIEEGNIKGIFVVTLSPREDERGFFMRTYDHQIFMEYGIDRQWVQENHSRSLTKGIIRGLHFQFPPFAETKLIRAVRGAVLDVFVDLRKGSGSFGKWGAVELSEDNKKCVLVPRGFAHGFCTLSECSEVVYKVDNYYSPGSEGGIMWNDQDININWPVVDPVLSAKDRNNLTLAEFIEKYQGIDL